MKNYFDNIFKNINDNIKLDNKQIEIIKCNDKKQMIIAGAGSGKTTIIIAKIKYLIDILNIKQKDILVISYTNETVNELNKRINNDFNYNIEICTFHKFCLKILNNKNKIIAENNYIIEKYLKDNKYKKELIDFFKLYRLKNYNIQLLKKQYHRKSKKYKFLCMFEKLYTYYNEYLNQNNLIDFDQIIIKAYEKIEKINYKYIIIDEYQDISEIRFKIIEKIVKYNDVNLIVVGDDFQTIYSFSGSNINLFFDFKNKMNATQLNLSKTYRNSQELINIVGSFIMKNKYQIKKILYSNKSLINPIKLISYKRNKKQIVEKILNSLSETNQSILLLGRYNKDIDFLLDNNLFIKQGNKIIYKNMDITFLTVHTSKGLGFDNVIILNNENGKYGFPSKIKDSKYLKIIKEKEKYKFAEERRLFYVALTRTKNYVYLIYPRNNPSIFIKEIKNMI